MANHSSKKANTFLLTENRDLRGVFAKIKALTELDHHIKPFLDENLRDYCQAANLIGDRLIMVASNSSIATQLRFQTTDLLIKFKQYPPLANIKAIHCKVSPASPAHKIPPKNKQERKMEPLSAETADIVRDIAKSVSDPKLREVMEKIAKHKKK